MEGYAGTIILLLYGFYAKYAGKPFKKFGIIEKLHLPIYRAKKRDTKQI